MKKKFQGKYQRKKNQVKKIWEKFQGKTFEKKKIQGKKIEENILGKKI